MTYLPWSDTLTTGYHVPAEKRPLEEKALPKKRVRITPVMRCVSRRSERPMAPVQIPQPPVQIPDVLEPVPIPDVPPSPVHIPQPPVHIPQPPVQIPDVPEHVQIPMSQVPQPPMQILPEPMNILHVYQNLCRFQCHKSHSHLSRFSQNL
ncbi:hypothetical protein TNCV_1397441 [Trichonephila clavipes]|nr:hypothetical protein TNCV_1397441 [Trichonephila clavipes]